MQVIRDVSFFYGRQKERFFCDNFCHDILFNIEVSDIINSNDKSVHKEEQSSERIPLGFPQGREVDGSL